MTKEQIEILEKALDLLKNYPLIFNMSSGRYYCSGIGCAGPFRDGTHEEKCQINCAKVKLEELIEELKKND